MQLSDAETYAWQARLAQETTPKNITLEHARIATMLLGLLLDGVDTIDHRALAAMSGRSVTCVQDTLRRLRQLGLLDWEHQFKTIGGRRRQIANRYWIRLPDGAAVPRPDIRRHRGSGVHRPSKEGRKIAYEQVVWVAPAAIDLLLRRREQFATKWGVG